MIIAISGPPGAGTSSVARTLAKELGLRYLSPGSTYKSYLKEKEAKAALDFWKTAFGSSAELHKSLDKNQIEEAKKGSLVTCGKLSIHFLKDLADFKIWVEASLEVRAERSSGRDGIDAKEAKRQIKKREDIERKKWKEMYGFDYFDQKKEADLVLDTSGLTLKETVDRILKFIKKS